MRVFIYFFTALAASFIGAVSGIGGGVIMKPVLDSMGEFPPAAASFLSGCTVLAMAVSSMLRRRNALGSKNLRLTVYLSLGAAAGGIFGKQAASAIGGNLGLIQTALLLLVNGAVLIYVRNKKRAVGLTVVRREASMGIGLALGFVSSFLGIGGGPLNLAVLYFFFSMEAKEAAGNSLFIIFVSQTASLGAVLLTHTVPDFPPAVLLLMCTGGVTGAVFGSAAAKRMDDRRTEGFFSLLLWFLIGLNVFHLFQIFCD
ncbi:MAG: sulfite exporter TauE/SafE family protein [Lachnospiraceae bacterium]|jgi:uncharacterized membrane protein YfcA|nr:sulfite exporter TauE/SafE family protein [Lachnospiraceae bacterium]